MLAAGDTHRVRVGAVLGGSLFGALTSSPVAVALLGVAQRLVDLPGRVTQVLVQPRPGADRLVASELRGIAGGRLDVAAADNELHLLDQAIKPNSQSTELFSAISVMVGIPAGVERDAADDARASPASSPTCACRAMTGGRCCCCSPSRRSRSGVVASLVGVALGDVLSSAFFHRVPTYLAAAFPIGAKQIVHAKNGAGRVRVRRDRHRARFADTRLRPAGGQGRGRRVSRVGRQGRDHRRTRDQDARGRRAGLDRASLRRSY